MSIETRTFRESIELQYVTAAGECAPPRKRVRWCPLSPVTTLVRRKLFRRAEMSLCRVADKSWEVAPGQTTISRRAYSLPNQLERVTGTAYTDNPQREMAGGIESFQMPTQGYLVKDAWLLDGSLYKGNARSCLHPRTQRLPRLRVDDEIERCVIYSSYDGIGFFGLWLTEDCTKYRLAEQVGLPVTTNLPPGPHHPGYENWLKMSPFRFENAFLREVILFDDLGQNPHKLERLRANRDRLLSFVNAEPHAGVFILRRDSGKRRILLNELELAEYLRERRGFRILDITKADVPTIVTTCAGAKVVVGVEGSQLVHGVMVLQPGGAVLTLQPPNRFCGVVKRSTDSNEQHYGFVVGYATTGGFHIDPTEVERTLDLFPTSTDT